MILDLLGTLPTPSPAAGSRVVVGVVAGVEASGRAVSVSVLGSAPLTLPATASVWAGVRTCWVLTDAAGRPAYVLGPAPDPGGAVPAPPARAHPAATARVAVAVPAATRTWWAGHGWGVWDATGTRASAATDLYQGTAPTGGALTGVAVYGDQVTALAPTLVTSASLTLTPYPGPAPWELVVRACPDPGEEAPAPTGPAVTTTVDGPATLVLDVTALGPALAGGAGLALTGTAYGTVSGDPPSMSLSLGYETTGEAP